MTDAQDHLSNANSASASSLDLAPIRLIPGENTTTWPEMKMARASSLWHELEARLELWTATQALVVEPRQLDGRTIAWVVRNNGRIPLEEWSLIFGDIVHNLRSALDAFAYEASLLTEPGPSSDEQRKIYFPTAHKEEQWDKAVTGSLRFIPDEILGRVREFQPFAQPEPNNNFLHHLHAMDIQDKHIGQMYLGVNPAQLLQENIEVVLQERMPGDEGKVEIKLNTDVPYEVKDGVILNTTTYPADIVEVRSLVMDRTPVRVWLNRDGELVQVADYVPEIIAETKNLIAAVRQGGPALPGGSQVLG